jgi:hypothetical protein
MSLTKLTTPNLEKKFLTAGAGVSNDMLATKNLNESSSGPSGVSVSCCSEEDMFEPLEDQGRQREDKKMRRQEDRTVRVWFFQLL